MPPSKKTGNSGSTGEKIKKLKEEGKTWADISEIVGLPQGKAMMEYEREIVTPKTRISGKTEEDLQANIAKARQDGLSWGIISARSGKSEGYCRTAFENVTKESSKGNRIGKGGRYPDGDTPAKAAKATKATKKAGPVKKATKALKKTAKKTPAKKAVAAKKTAKKAAA